MDETMRERMDRLVGAVQRAPRERSDDENLSRALDELCAAAERWAFIQPHLQVSSYLADKHADRIVEALYLSPEHVELQDWDYDNPPHASAVDEAVDRAISRTQPIHQASPSEGGQ